MTEPDLFPLLEALADDAADPARRREAILAGGRRRVRRRRSLVAGSLTVVVAALVGTGVAVGGDHGGRSAGVLTVASPAPSSPESASLAPAPADTVPSPAPLDVTLAAPVAVVDTQGIALLRGRSRTELPDTAHAEFPSLSHDGRNLSWLVPNRGTTDLHVLDLTTPDETVLADIASYAWSPVGDTLARCGPEGLSVGGPHTLEAHTLPGNCSGPVWSPDGRRLAATLGRSTVVVSASLAPVATLPYAIRVARFVGNGLLLWPDPSYSGSIAADGLELDDVNLATLQSFPVAETLAYPDWVQPLGGNTFVVVTGVSREAHDHKTPVTFDIPDDPTAADPPHRAAVQAVSVPGKTSLLSLASSMEGTVATVTVPADSGLDSITVDGVLGLQRGGAVTTYPEVGKASAVVPTRNGKVAGALVLTSTNDSFAAGRLHLVDASGSYDLGPVAPLLTDDYSLAGRDYYSHVDPATLIGQPAGS